MYHFFKRTECITTLNTECIAGGRTGLTSVFCGTFFYITMFLSPIALLIPSCAAASVLIYVGISDDFFRQEYSKPLFLFS